MKSNCLTRDIFCSIISLAILISVSFVSATQVIPNQVDPQIGENLWQMNYRQSITIDDILDTTTLCCNCDFFITQADIDGNGGGFTIPQAGNWCLGENIVTTQPIVISGVTGVVFDLKGRTISSTVKGAFADAVGIIDVDNAAGTIIKNGYILGLDLGAFAQPRSGVRLTLSNDSIVQNIETRFFASVDSLSVTEGNFAVFAASNNVQILTCFATGPFLNAFTIFGNDAIIKNCTVSHFNGYQITGPITNLGTGYWLNGDNNYLENCTSMGGAAQPTTASAGEIGFFIQGDRNMAIGCIALNHKLNAHPTFSFDGGSGFHVIGDNCELSNCTSAYNENYGIFNTGAELMLCNNEVHSNGTNFFGAPNTNLCNLLCDDYILSDRIPFTITQPGQYCFSGQTLETNGDTAIIVADGVQDVNINLNGYSLIRTSVGNNQPLITIGTSCNNITIHNGTLRGNSAASSENIGVSVSGTTYQDVSMTELRFQNFDTPVDLRTGGNNVYVAHCSFFDSLSNAITCSNVPNISVESCDGYNNNGFIKAVNCPNTSIRGCSIQGGAESANDHISCSSRSDNLIIADTTITYGQSNGINIDGSNNVTLSNVSAQYHGQNGILCTSCRDLNLDSTLTTSNAGRGVTIDGCENINLNDCISRRNVGDGFGLLNYATAVVSDCFAMTNLLTGFYAFTGFALTMDGCTASGNLLRGFHLDSDTLAANVIACVATENLQAGFLSADIGALVAITPLSHRFHGCHAVFNGAVPGATDYSQANTVGVIMLIPLAAPTGGVLATTPGLSIPFQPTPAADFSTYL